MTGIAFIIAAICGCTWALLSQINVIIESLKDISKILEEIVKAIGELNNKQLK